MAERLMLALVAMVSASSVGFASAAVDTSGPSPNSANAQLVQAALANRLREAADNLSAGGDRLHATRALDAARRLARVEASLVGCPGAATSISLKAVESARRALQNGRTEVAVALLRQASQASSPSLPSACTAGSSAVGKLVMNRHGERIGRLVSLTPGGGAILKVGGAINWFGFLDFGNSRRTVPAGQLVEGRRMVVLLNS